MSIKRISRRRVAAPVTEYVNEVEDARAGGNVVTKATTPNNKASVPTNKSVPDTESRVSTILDVRDGSYSKWSA